MTSSGIMICGHGSRDSKAVQEFEELTLALAERFPDNPLAHGFLELAEPDIPTGLASLQKKDVTSILAIPLMLFAAGHVNEDIPSVLNAFAADHTDLNIHFGRELGPDPKMLEAAQARITEAISNASTKTNHDETLLLVVGRGANDKVANETVKNICQTLMSDMKFGHGGVCYAGIASPLLEPALEDAAKSGYKRIIVFPYLLYTGYLVNKIYTTTDQIAEAYPGVKFLKAPYLGNHPKVIETLADRIQELL